MDPQLQQAYGYVNQMRASGYNDQQIAQSLISAGWPPQLITGVLGGQVPVTNLYPATGDYVNSATYGQQKSKKKLVLVMAATAIIVLISIAVLALTLRNRANTDSSALLKPDDSSEQIEFVTFTDPNFSVDLPSSWTGDAGYEPGAEVVLFYSPEATSTQDNHKAAKMVVYKVSQSYDRIKQQTDKFAEEGTQYETARDETIKFGEYEGRLVELVVSSKEQPAKKIRVASISVKGPQSHFFADVVVNEQYWSLHQAAVDKLLRSFRPLK